MVLILILVILGVLVVLLSSWRRNRKLLSEASRGSQDRDAGRTTALERANEDLKTAQAELQRRWQYLAEAQRLSHSGTFGWKVRSGKLVWSDETYTILGLTRETNPTLDLVFDRIPPEDRDRRQSRVHGRSYRYHHTQTSRGRARSALSRPAREQGLA